MDYRLLGSLEVHDSDRSLALGGAKQRALLALLLVNANHVVPRDRLIDELWGDQPPETCVPSLQVYVSRLRKLLPPGTVRTQAPGYVLEVAADELDLERFERLLAEGRDALRRADPQRASRLLHEALALWRGPALAEFAFDEFAQPHIRRLDDLRLAAVEERIEADLALGRHADQIGELEALVAENPHRERLRGQLMVALYRSGRQAEALAAYQAGRRALDELGIAPGNELQRLERQILTHDRELDAPRRPEPGDPPVEPRPVERKLVTVVFADLRMRDGEEADPEQAAAFADRVHGEAAAEIEAAGGTIEKGFAGAVLAAFEADAARRDDHAVRAASAALATRKRLADAFGDAVSLRMAIASGEAILGRRDSFVTGRPVATATRLVRLAEPGQVVVGEPAATAIAGAFELRQRNGAYVVVDARSATSAPSDLRRRRRRLVRAAALVGAAAVATAVVLATRAWATTVPRAPSPSSIRGRTGVVGHVPLGSRPDGVAVGGGAVSVAAGGAAYGGGSM
jgi:DNA-binding SARP family transcriptional activator